MKIIIHKLTKNDFKSFFTDEWKLMNSKSQNKSRKKKHAIAKCYNCGKTGHIKFDCPGIKSETKFSIKNIHAIEEFCSFHQYYYIIFENERESHLFYGLTPKDVIKTLSKDRKPIKIRSYLGLSAICSRLKAKGLVDFRMVAEDKRSGPNLVQMQKLEGKIINHTFPQMIGDSRNCDFFPRICELYDIHVFSPEFCKNAVTTFLLCKPFSRDLRLLIAREIWNSRYDHSSWVSEENSAKKNYGKYFEINVIFE